MENETTTATSLTSSSEAKSLGGTRSEPMLTVGAEFEFLFGFLSLGDVEAGESPTIAASFSMAPASVEPVAAGEVIAGSPSQRGEDGASPLGIAPACQPTSPAAAGDPWGDPSLAGRLASLNLIQPALFLAIANVGPYVMRTIYRKIQADLAAAGFTSKIHGLSSTGSGDGFQNTWWHHAWTVKSDPSVSRGMFQGPWGVRQRFRGVELTTPILDTSDAGFNQIGVAARVIKENNRVAVNKTCGFHVHVGLSHGGWDCITVKKFVSLTWLADARLARLVRPHRRGNRYCMPMTAQSRLAHVKLDAIPLIFTDELNLWMPPELVQTPTPSSASISSPEIDMDGDGNTHFPPSPGTADSPSLSPKTLDYCHRMAHLFTQSDLKKLVELVARVAVIGSHTSGGMSISFRPIFSYILDRSGRDAKPTVEFRLLEGTLNPRTAISWARLCVRFVQIAGESSPAEFKMVITGLLKCYDGEDDDGDATKEMLDVLSGGVLVEEAVRHLKDKMVSGDHFTCCDHSDPTYSDGG